MVNEVHPGELLPAEAVLSGPGGCSAGPLLPRASPRASPCAPFFPRTPGRRRWGETSRGLWPGPPPRPALRQRGPGPVASAHLGEAQGTRVSVGEEQIAPRNARELTRTRSTCVRREHSRGISELKTRFAHELPPDPPHSPRGGNHRLNTQVAGGGVTRLRAWAGSQTSACHRTSLTGRVLATRRHLPVTESLLGTRPHSRPPSRCLSLPLSQPIELEPASCARPEQEREDHPLGTQAAEPRVSPQTSVTVPRARLPPDWPGCPRLPSCL